MAGGDIFVRDSIFNGNRSHLGGAIYAFNNATLINNIFNGNRATTAPGNAGGGAGGALILTGPSTLLNNTITNNSATDGAGGVIAAVSPGEVTEIVNTILWGNFVTKPPVPGEDPIPLSRKQLARVGDVNVSYGILEGLYEPIPGEDPINRNEFPGVLDTDPLFVNVFGADGIPGNEDDDLHLDSNSPAIDAGDNTSVIVGVNTDFDGEPRFQDDPATTDTGNGAAPIVDMGAYEVAGIPGDNIPPIAFAVASPLSGEVPLDVQFSATGSADPDGQIVSYHWDFGDGSSSIAVDPVLSYQAVGIYTVVLTVTDDQGAMSTDSVTINVTPDTTKPTVSITAPIAGSTVSGLVNISADAFDFSGIKKVIFKIGRQKIGKAKQAPFQLTWDTTAFANGQHKIKVTAFDFANNRKTTKLKVIVNNDPTM